MCYPCLRTPVTHVSGLYSVRGEGIAGRRAYLPKSERHNIDDDELARWRVAAASWLRADNGMLALAVKDGLLIEVKDDG